MSIRQRTSHGQKYIKRALKAIHIFTAVGLLFCIFLICIVCHTIASIKIDKQLAIFADDFFKSKIREVYKTETKIVKEAGWMLSANVVVKNNENNRWRYSRDIFISSREYIDALTCPRISSQLLPNERISDSECVYWFNLNNEVKKVDEHLYHSWTHDPFQKFIVTYALGSVLTVQKQLNNSIARDHPSDSERNMKMQLIDKKKYSLIEAIKYIIDNTFAFSEFLMMLYIQFFVFLERFCFYILSL